MRTQSLTFSNNQGQQLYAKLALPVDSEPKAYAVFAHCFTCTKNIKAIRHISESLTDQGIAVLRFDFTGLGQSEGDFSDTNFSSNVSDLVEAAAFLEKNYDAPQMIIGHSLGGAAVLHATPHIPSLKAVVTIAAPYEPEHVTHLFQESLEEIQSSGKAHVDLGGRSFVIKQQFVDDLNTLQSSDVVPQLQKPLLVLHSPVDTTVGVHNAAEIFQAAKHPKSFISLDQADHLLSKPEDAKYAGMAIAGWAQKYLKLELPETPEQEHSQSVVVRTGAGFRSQVLAGKHRLVADEPESLNGTNMGPSPYEFLLTSLGACTGMTLRMYADRKELPLDEVEVSLQHHKVNDPDKGWVDVIDRKLLLKGDLDEAQLKRLLEIADKCPVHKTLHSEIQVNTTLV